jgi:hypothetical protein
MALASDEKKSFVESSPASRSMSMSSLATMLSSSVPFLPSCQTSSRLLAGQIIPETSFLSTDKTKSSVTSVCCERKGDILSNDISSTDISYTLYLLCFIYVVWNDTARANPIKLFCSKFTLYFL